MEQRVGLEFFLMRYAPRFDQEAHVNIGVLAVSSDGKFAGTRFLQNWKKVLSFDPRADIKMLQGIAQEIADDWQKQLDRAGLLARMEASFSNAIRISGKMYCLSSDPEKETDRLATMYL